MADLFKGNRDTLPDHGSSSGDAIVHTITINLHASGALSVCGQIANKAWALAMLENAKDAVKNYKERAEIIVPGKDVSIHQL